MISHFFHPKTLYTRYVDNTSVILNDIASLQDLVSNFSEESVLRFTCELEKDGQLALLDCVVRNFEEGYRTSVLVKNTKAGDCLNYKSICPEKYKVVVIEAILHRSYHVSSNSQMFHVEIDLIKQLLTDNNFPMQLLDSTIKKFLDIKMTPNTNMLTNNTVNFWF